MMKNHLVLLYLLIEVNEMKKNLMVPKKTIQSFLLQDKWIPTLSLGDNDCVIWLLLLFVVVDSVIDDGDDGTLTICGKWDVESTTRLDILFVAVILLDAYEWCWLESVACVDESVADDIEEYVPLVNVDDGPMVLVIVEFDGDDTVAAVNNVGIKG